jgi:hypothetical protein
MDFKKDCMAALHCQTPGGAGRFSGAPNALQIN